MAIYPRPSPNGANYYKEHPTRPPWQPQSFSSDLDSHPPAPWALISGLFTYKRWSPLPISVMIKQIEVRALNTGADMHSNNTSQSLSYHKINAKETLKSFSFLYCHPFLLYSSLPSFHHFPFCLGYCLLFLRCLSWPRSLLLLHLSSHLLRSVLPISLRRPPHPQRHLFYQPFLYCYHLSHLQRKENRYENMEKQSFFKKYSHTHIYIYIHILRYFMAVLPWQLPLFSQCLGNHRLRKALAWFLASKEFSEHPWQTTKEFSKQPTCIQLNEKA